ncbi:MAG TPA: CocE/NonD family hydrolase, partial [Bacteroidales bacterium]|nr:CocE/NonD family hydrolase [Bacteroidales bacterium]
MRKILLFAILVFAAATIYAQILTPAVDSITMRDGKKLDADIYLPDTSGGQTYPTVLIQTPYNRLWYRFSLPLIGTAIGTSPFAFVILDWRCFYGSAEACVTTPDRGADGFDAVEWIATQSWSDGQVATWGPSALGRVQYMTAKKNPPHLVCAVPL